MPACCATSCNHLSLRGPHLYRDLLGLPVLADSRVRTSSGPATICAALWWKCARSISTNRTGSSATPTPAPPADVTPPERRPVRPSQQRPHTHNICRSASSDRFRSASRASVIVRGFSGDRRSRSSGTSTTLTRSKDADPATTQPPSRRESRIDLSAPAVTSQTGGLRLRRSPVLTR
jgi:hypothetical protein